MRDWLERLAHLLDRHAVAIVTVLSAEGSTPREAGARMLVTADAIEGTIGGGALEFAAMDEARTMLAGELSWQRRVIEVPLGPAVQQCCGGFVTLLIEILTQRERGIVAAITQERAGLIVRPTSGGMPWLHVRDRKQAGDLPLPVVKVARAMARASRRAAMTTVDAGEMAWLVEPIQQLRTPLYLYGAGHVGREVVTVLDGLAYDITWIDESRSRFPDVVDPAVTVVATTDPQAIARAAIPGALHVVMTFSHALDEAITAALLNTNTFGYLGLIGSKTKRARFLQRFRRAGIGEAAIARLTCPIGLPGIPGKEPRAIAIALASELLHLAARQEEQSNVRAASIQDR